MADVRERIEEANAEAARRMIAGDPVLVDVAPAREVIPAFQDGRKLILHSGPPVTWERMAGAQKGSAVAIALFEGWAKTPQEAWELLASGEVAFAPNHAHRAVGPMAGTISPSLPVFVVENKAFGNRAFCRPVEDRQQFGDYSPGAVETLWRWRDVFGPALRAALRTCGGLPLKPLIARALEMGDELHNRQVAASSLLANALAIPLLEAHLPREQLLATLRLLVNHPVFFLGPAMAAAKAIADPARNIPYATVVVAMARNGTEFGIQVSGLGDEWFTAPAPPVQGLLFPGYRPEDAGLDMGDSAITETVGWGAFVLGGAPGILSLVGGTVAQALAYTREMREITVAVHPEFRIPALDFQGIALGIDIRKVGRTGITPLIDTAIAHKDPGHPKIGAGLVRAPFECFKKALLRFAEKYEVAKVG
ncbi:MAG: DUF1116 domain-containing protein [Candidatus Bipolaricaulota bacterium]|nr:DUF1116 domain-containing protein [Candidatus Bipolaricaulota bacterium]MCX7844183.1 DUF1116 domain-containing protein [Candidatus Bipolaricaulota bacterium]MDW8151999.1 DUF1116 domain-containing protein [Candidatus Bipolaricaulota bacterium]